MSITEDILEIDLTEPEDLKTTKTTGSGEDNSTVDLTTKNDRLTENQQEIQQKTNTSKGSGGEKMTSLGMGIGMVSGRSGGSAR